MTIIRRMQWKSFTFLLMFLVGLGLPGCQRWVDSPQPSAHQGIVLRVACPPKLTELVQSHARAWQGQQQAQIEIVEYSLNEDPFSLERIDLCLLRPADLPQGAAAEKLQPVPPQFTQRGTAFDWNGLLPLYREQLLLWNGKAYGIALVGESPLLLYRTDLFASAEWRARFLNWSSQKKLHTEFREPASWEDLAVLAEFLKENRPNGSARASLTALPEDPVALDRLFYQIAACYARRAIRQDEPEGQDHLNEVFAFHYDLETGAPRIATAGFVAALKQLKRLKSCMPEKAEAVPEKAFVEGRAWFALTDASWLMEAQKRPELRDKVGIAALPGSARYFTFQGSEKSLKGNVNRVPYLGEAGWIAVVPTTAVHSQAAWHLLGDLGGPTRSYQIALEPRYGGGPVRTEQLLRDRWDAFDLDLARSMTLREVLGRTVLQHGIKNPVICLRVPDQARHRDVMVSGLRRVLLENADVEKTLAEVARQWHELDEKRGRKTFLSEYRLSLGLLAK